MSPRNGQRRLSPATHLLAAVLVCCAPGSQPAGKKPPVEDDRPARKYAVREIRLAAGGSPIQELADGIVYAPELNQKCLEVAGDGPSPAFATALGEPLRLAVTLAGCEPTEGAAIEPGVECGWTLEPGNPEDSAGAMIAAGAASCRPLSASARTGSVSWQGWRGSIDLPPFDETGTYRFSLSCQVAGESSPVLAASQVFVTYGEPLTAFSPPKRDWYAQAACWGAGLDAETDEATVIETLLEEIYRYGERRWRYGYGRWELLSSSYYFDLFDGAAGSMAIKYDIANEEYKPTCSLETCKCSWQGLVARGSPCNFGDCFIFSDLLEATSAVMGVGGLRFFTITGEAGLGFLTHPTQSLDPAFPGNVTCPSHWPTCLPYYFLSHNLRLRDGRYYDTTFGRVYDRPHQPIALSKKALQDGILTFLESELTLTAFDHGYGNWRFYGKPAQDGATERAGGELQFTGEVKFEPSQWLLVYQSLEVEVELELLVEGEHLIHGRLYGDDATLVAQRPSWWSTQPSVAIISGSGRQTVKLAFSGQEIFDSATDGPYRLVVGVQGESQLAERAFESPAYHYRDFGELGAGIQGEVIARGVDSDLDGGVDSLAITVPLAVRWPDVYALEARLANGDVTVGYAGRKQQFEGGEEPVEVELAISGEALAARGRGAGDGPYALTLVLYDGALTAIQAEELPIEGFEAALFE